MIQLIAIDLPHCCWTKSLEAHLQRVSSVTFRDRIIGCLQQYYYRFGEENTRRSLAIAIHLAFFRAEYMTEGFERGQNADRTRPDNSPASH
jgi:hypothetical protein